MLNCYHRKKEVKFYILSGEVKKKLEEIQELPYKTDKLKKRKIIFKGISIDDYINFAKEIKNLGELVSNKNCSMGYLNLFKNYFELISSNVNDYKEIFNLTEGQVLKIFCYVQKHILFKLYSM